MSFWEVLRVFCEVFGSVELEIGALSHSQRAGEEWVARELGQGEGGLEGQQSALVCGGERMSKRGFLG